LFFGVFFISSCQKNNGKNINSSSVDLSQFNFKGGNYHFNGDWEFYWKQIPIDSLHNFDISKLKNKQFVSFYKGTWKELGYSSKGFGTFRFQLILPDTINQYTLTTQRVKSSCQIWINEEKYKEIGQFHKEEELVVPSAKTLYVNLPKQKHLDIVIPVSNYQHRVGGGFTAKVLLGLEEKIKNKRYVNLIIETSLTIVVFLIGLFQLFFYFLQKKKFFLFLFLACLAGGARQMFVGEVFLYNFFPEISYSIIQRGRYITYYLSIVFLTIYLWSLFKKNVKVSTVYVVVVPFIFGSICMCVLPVYFATKLALFYQFYAVFFLLFIIALAIKLDFKQNNLHRLVLMNFVGACVFILNDLLYARGIINTMFLSNYTILLFVSIQAIINYLFQAEIENKNKTMKLLIEQKGIMLKEIHHRVKNNFQLISSLIEMQTRDITDKKALSLLEEGKNRIKSMALIHQKLYNDDDFLINVHDYVGSLVKDIASAYGKDKTATISLNIPNLKFDIDTAIPIGLIINELITNAYKYGLTNERQELSIAMRSIFKGTYVLEVKDNGVGLPDKFDFNKSKSLGLRLVRRLSKQLYGSTSYLYEKGALFSIEFKDTNSRTNES